HEARLHPRIAREHTQRARAGRVAARDAAEPALDVALAVADCPAHASPQRGRPARGLRGLAAEADDRPLALRAKPQLAAEVPLDEVLAPRRLRELALAATRAVERRLEHHG